MKTKPIYVIEISSGSVKAASFESGKKGLGTLKSFYRESYDSKPKMEEAVKNAAKIVTEKSAVFGTSVWAATMMTRKVLMDVDMSEDIRTTINLEAEKHVPFPINECMIDGYAVKETEDGNKSDVMFIASKKDLIDERCRFLKDMGYQLGFMDIHPIAMTNLYTLCNESVPKAVAIVHLGDAPGKIKGEENFASVCFEGRPAVIRDLGTKLSEPEVGETQWRYVVTQVANAVSFFENSMKEKVVDFKVSGEASACEEFINRYKEHAATEFTRWSALDRINYADEALKSKAQENEAAVMLLYGIASRKIHK